MSKIPEGYKVEPFTDVKQVKSGGYKHWTVADLREMLADFPDKATVWVSRYDDAEDDLYIHPLETFGGSTNGKDSYVIL